MLSEVLPIYCKVLLDEEYQDYLAEIRIDGYTDTDGDYLYNLQLSQERALAVANYLMSSADRFLTSEELTYLKGKLTANGHSMSNPVYDEDGEIDKDASRRVEIKFSLKDEEMINEMKEILDQNQ
jgi:chemotaxis protein MotB